MEATTAPSTVESTGSQTIADLLPKAAEKYADKVAVKYKDKESGEWRDVTFREVGEIVSEIGRGLIDLGIEPGDRVSLLCNTRAGVDVRRLRHLHHRRGRRADLPDQLAGGVRVGRRQQRLGRDRLRGRDAGREDRRRSARTCRPQARHRHRPGRRRRRRDHDRRPARARPRPRGERAASSGPRRSSPTTRSPSSTRRARPARRRAACSRTATTARSWTRSRRCGTLGVGDEDLTYLFLPLAHAFALLIQLVSFDVGAPIAYFGGDTKAIVGELGEVKPTYLPSVPRIFEKIYAMAAGQPGRPSSCKAIREIGGKVKDLEVRGEPIPDDLKEQWEPLAPGRRLRQARCSAGACARPSPAPRRSPRRSSSSSGAAASRCSRATA